LIFSGSICVGNHTTRLWFGPYDSSNFASTTQSKAPPFIKGIMTLRFGIKFGDFKIFLIIFHSTISVSIFLGEISEKGDFKFALKT
jgi:hypothetical protein